MNKNISEQERRKLNKKLVKKTFVSEFKNESKRKMNVIDFICAFIACFVAEAIVEILQIDSWFFDIVVSIPIIAIVLFVLEIFVEKLKSKF